MNHAGFSNVKLAQNLTRDTEEAIGVYDQAEELDVFVDIQTDKEKRGEHRLKYTLNRSPFSDLESPISEECERICGILRKAHNHHYQAPSSLPKPDPSICGCGEVDNVLEALVRAHMSVHVTMGLADKAYTNPYSTYPVFEDGPVAGTLDWEAVRTGSMDTLVGAIAVAGMVSKKSTEIMAILNHVEADEDMRRAALKRHVREAGGDDRIVEESSGNRTARAAKMASLGKWALLNHDKILTLDYLFELSPAKAMELFMLYRDVAQKAASCVVLFCMQYPVYPVDAHVQRLSNWLGWTKGKDRVKTFHPANAKVPDSLKYELHQLLIVHGQECGLCGTHEASRGWEGTCPIEDFVQRSGQRPWGTKKERKRKPKPADEGEVVVKQKK